MTALIVTALLLFGALLWSAGWLVWQANQQVIAACAELEAFCWDAEVIDVVLAVSAPRQELQRD